MQPAIFLDRDGTINIDHGYVSKVDDFEFYPEVIETLAKLKAKGYLLVLVTNQSGIARGYFTENEFLQLTEWMDWSLADRGVDLDGIFYCPHHPSGKVKEFACECECRKPKAGMFIEAQKSLNIDMDKSVMIGDKWSDIQAASLAGVKKCYLINASKDELDNNYYNQDDANICNGLLEKFSDILALC